MQKVEDMKRPLKKGEYYKVPCIVSSFNDKLCVTPVINHPHSDRENGQPEVHYHVDYRFLKHKNDGDFPTVVNRHSKYYFVDNIRPEIKSGQALEYFVLPVINEDFNGITPVDFISKSKIKHKCIHKGKCPHRGYDLSQVKSVDGIITCPLHGLKFDATTGALLNNKGRKTTL